MISGRPSVSMTKNVSFTMKRMSKPDESGDSSSFSYLPDEIVLQVLSRLIDLKTLCRCKLVSIRFNHIVQQVNAISFTLISVDHASINSSDPYTFLLCGPFVSAMKSLQTFSALKSLSIEIPFFHKSADNPFLLKWKLFSNSNCSDSFLFLSPNSVCDTKENVQDEEEQEEEDVELSRRKLLNARGWMMDALFIRVTMMSYIECFPLLENVVITDAGKRGRVSLCGGNFSWENFIRSMEIFLRLLKSDIENNTCNCLRRCYVPLLKLPVSGYMMKGVTLALCQTNDLPDGDSFKNINLNDFEDKEGAAYSEAVMEIFKKNRERIFG